MYSAVEKFKTILYKMLKQELFETNFVYKFYYILNFINKRELNFLKFFFSKLFNNNQNQIYIKFYSFHKIVRSSYF